MQDNFLLSSSSTYVYKSTVNTDGMMRWRKRHMMLYKVFSIIISPCVKKKNVRVSQWDIFSCGEICRLKMWVESYHIVTVCSCHILWNYPFIFFSFLTFDSRTKERRAWSWWWWWWWWRGVYSGKQAPFWEQRDILCTALPVQMPFH